MHTYTHIFFFIPRKLRVCWGNEMDTNNYKAGEILKNEAKIYTYSLFYY